VQFGFAGQGSTLNHPEQTEGDPYRVIVLRDDATLILLLSSDKGLVLPEVTIPRQQRIAENITREMRRKWGQEVVCLFTLTQETPATDNNSVHYQIAEHLRSAVPESFSGHWFEPDTLSEISFARSSDFQPVQQALARHALHRTTAESNPFGVCGWFRKLTKWAEESVGPIGLQLTGSFTQFNASPSFALVRLETSADAIWFKAVGEPNVREYAVTLALAELFPDYVPRILGTRQSRTAWLSAEAQGAALETTDEIVAWKRAATTLARLQIDSTKEVDRLLAAGAHDLRMKRLAERVEPFFHVAGELMMKQTTSFPRTLSREELRILAECVGDCIAHFQQLNIPDSLGHLDLNPGNIILSEDRCVFLDWAEAIVGAPFFSLEYLIEHFQRATSREVTDREQIVQSYYAPWAQLLSSDTTAAARSLAPLLAAFAYAGATDAWTGSERWRGPEVAAYLRSLTRRMWREANQLKDVRSRSESGEVRVCDPAC
jgi:Phosphotransferase enzyme family